MKLKMIALIGVIKKEDCSNETSSKTKNIQKASTPPSAEKSHFLQQVAEYVSKKRGRG